MVNGDDHGDIDRWVNLNEGEGIALQQVFVVDDA